MAYKIELIPSGIPGARDTMYRGGKRFTIGQAQIFDLTEEELELFKNDARFKISDSKDSGEPLASGTVAESKRVPSAESSATEEVAPGETETAPAEVVASAEEANAAAKASEGIEGLLRDYSREELNAKAKKAGVKKPEKLDNKSEVAQAIVDAR